jgi:hypothetical protein
MRQIPPVSAQFNIELERIAPLAEAAKLSSLSPDTLVREHSDKII